MRLLLIPFILTIICCAGITPVSAQTFPVQSNVQFIPPYSLYLSDYAIAGQEKILVQLLLKDITVNHYRVKLKLKIEGVGITIATPENFSGPPISLQGGAPLTLTAFELAPYFNLRNLQFAGLNKSDFQRTGRLPEGVYKFTIEVYDFNRTKQVAAPASAMAWIVLNDPPFVNLPVNNHKVTNILPQFIAFQWTPRHMGSPNSAFSTEYVFKLVEIWPIERNPNDAMLSQRPIYETTTHQTQIVFGPAEPQLIPGRKYAWQVTARDTQKRDLFKNQGRSEVYMFQFGDACNAPKNVKVVSQGSTYLRTSWNSDPVHQNYSLQYREKGQKEWYGHTTISTQTSISSLKPGVTYEYQVQAGCGQISSDYSPVLTATTLEENKSQFVCGSPSVPQQITPGEPLLQILGTNDVIYYHNYEVRVKEITSASNGVYSGNAIALIPYLNYAHVKMTFKNIRVTQTYKVVSGEMESVWDPDSEWVYYDENPNSETDGSNPATEETEDSTTVTPPEDVITINFDGVIDSVYFNEDDQIVVVDTEGNVKEFDLERDKTTGEIEDTVITDGSGTSYTVTKDGITSDGASSDSDVAALPASPETIPFLQKCLAALRKTYSDSRIEEMGVAVSQKKQKLHDDLNAFNMTLTSQTGQVPALGVQEAFLFDFVEAENETSSETDLDAFAMEVKSLELEYYRAGFIRFLADSEDDEPIAVLSNEVKINDIPVSDFIVDETKKGTSETRLIELINAEITKTIDNVLMN